MKKSRKNRNQILSFMLLCVFFVTQVSLGQSLEDALGFNETVNDVPEAPINALLGIITLVGCYLGFTKLKD